MPFKKVGDDRYTSPSGRHFNGAQVRLYYAHGGHFPGQAPEKSYSKGGPAMKTYPVPSRPAPSGGEDNDPKEPKQPSYASGGYVKGHPAKVGSYAQGGPVLGRSRSFLKEPVEFRNPDAAVANADADNKYGKSGAGKGNGTVPAPKARSSKKLK